MSDSTSTSKKPICIISIGMAGSGKTTFNQRVNSYFKQQTTKNPYIINLDPAVFNVPYKPNLDIRDTVNYKTVMKEYGLGPNGAILTSLNLFTTKFEQVLDIVQKKEDKLDHILIDTPGQIEIFTWSASGAIITESLALSYPTVIAYIIDTPRTTSPATFMSNMLYACSILYKTRLPFILVFNKTDVQDHQFAVDWMQDFQKFQADIEQDQTYMSTFMYSMSLVLDEFYQHLKVVGVSSVTGSGMDDFMKAVNEAAEEYETDYKQDLLERMKQKEASEQALKAESLNKLMNDLKLEEKENN
ncbi:hypothetical protein CONCODRAFT_50801 [Conidiobolus coronatus NRRL 28638]|uniref:GPN-loop GTPase n=1 Tax=Conidiobolus coronatus (strain ATCC 28846 / CBS 209.66 / NRRL 28638) TaxID=796925 RepID=A0A137P327_CONC2|nr:hypothetical protein CONCODRAFT_50801 [Conidiobolus coronatus NRRL 28638]|eukprot:KXN69314.1 hypothetical protein CONCODRAFT_50801 [Conidiobolus coronatus NRRL 28638]